MVSIISPTTSGVRVIENASLTHRNTFNVAAKAAIFGEIDSLEGITQWLDAPEIQSLPRLILGEGSNVLFTRDWPGVVLHLNLHGIKILRGDLDSVFVRAEGGGRWCDLVKWCVERSLHGIENLALIPGTVGAAPIQNIGAYGMELSDTLHKVEVWDFKQKNICTLKNSECAFSYRDSLFKRYPDRYLITAIELHLTRHQPVKLDYGGIQEELNELKIYQPTIHDIFNIVCRLRRKKLPDPAVVGNAGSFFKNPLVATEMAQLLKREYPPLPIYPINDGHAKLSAAWLIERCGWKGFRQGDAGVSAQHALVLVNYRNASGTELWELAQRIQRSVKERFDIWLEPEPRVI